MGKSTALHIFAILLALSSFALTQSPTTDVPDPVIRSKVELTVVDVQVLNKKTKQVVNSLQREDFQLMEDGVPQHIAISSQDEMPLSVVFLFDLTDSVRPVLEPLAKRALVALNHLKPEDEVAVMVYSSTAKLVMDFDTDRDRAATAIHKVSKMESSEAAFFNEGLFQAARQSMQSSIPNARRVIIWLTDNVPNVPSEEIRRHYGRSIRAADLHTQEQAFHELLVAGAVVDCLLEQSEISERESMYGLNHTEQILQRLQYPPGDVYKYAEHTGGQVMETSFRKASENLAMLIDQIRTRYSLGYSSSEKSQLDRFRTIKLNLAPEILAREGKLIIRAKQGYYR